MREPERDLGRLMDILQAANHIQEFTDGLSIETLSIDKLRYFATVLPELLWQTALHDVPNLKKQIEAIINAEALSD